MNRPLPPRDRGSRVVDHRRASRPAWTVPGVIGLECRASVAAAQGVTNGAT